MSEQMRADAGKLRNLAVADSFVGDVLCEIADRLDRFAAAIPEGTRDSLIAWATNLILSMSDRTPERSLAVARRIVNEVEFRIERSAETAEARLDRIAWVAARWEGMLRTESEIMTTAQRNAWRDALGELRAVLR